MTTQRDTKIFYLGGSTMATEGWNKKLCFEARDTLHQCVDAQENGNKYRCPDELYAYEMWCPADFRRIHSAKYAKDKMEAQVYDKAWVDKVNEQKSIIRGGRWVQWEK